MHKHAIFMSFILILLLSAAAWADKISEVSYCTSCHGTDGAGPGATIPYLSGQSKAYLTSTLTEMRGQSRYGTVMLILAKGYDDAEIASIADWFSAKPWVSSANKIDPALADKGKSISKSKNCAGCHKGTGTFPKIAGQPSGYLNKALLEYKHELRSNAMMALAVELKDDEIQALAEYYSSAK
jgi:sulfide dehydrogenase cytochrome subunit